MSNLPALSPRCRPRTRLILLILSAVLVIALAASCTPVNPDSTAQAEVPSATIEIETRRTQTPSTSGGFAAVGFAPSRTPFQPVTNTPTVTITPTPTRTRIPIPTNTPIPPTPTPVPIPDEAYVNGVTGYAQTLPLSCEARSAVDWARHFGVDIAELDFMYALPTSLNPNEGFVGSPYGWWGQIPPNDYGVHAPPVAALLRAYGLNAWERSGMSYEDLRREIAAGRPVIVWVIGSVAYGSPASYTAPNGETLTVAAREHTVMITGYTSGAVRVQDGGMTYAVDIERFLASWGVLGNMAVVYEE